MDLWVIVVWGAILVIALAACVLLVVRDRRNHRRRRAGQDVEDDRLSHADAVARTMTLGVSQHVGPGTGGF